MRKFICLLLALCLMAPFAMAEEDEDELSLSDWMDMPVGQEQSADDVSAEDEAAEQLEPDGSQLITATFTGDFTIGGDSRKRTDIFNDELKKQGGDINFPLRNVRDILMADDLTLVNFEGTLTDSTYVPNNKKENQFLFSAPPEYVSILADNGIEAVALENNHVMDHGEEVYLETQQHLTDAGIVWSNAENIGEYTVKGVRIAMLSYQTFNLYDKLFTQVPLDIAEAKEKYDLVIVSFHWGAEKDYAPNANQQKMGKLAIDAGADLVVGHHSHRINPIEEYKGKYIVYSLGNFCFSGNKNPSDMSSFMFQMRWRVKDGVVTQDAWRIIPIRISSRTDYNDFTPTVLTKATSIDSLLLTLKENGKKLDNPVTEYPLEW